MRKATWFERFRDWLPRYSNNDVLEMRLECQEQIDFYEARNDVLTRKLKVINRLWAAERKKGKSNQ